MWGGRSTGDFIIYKQFSGVNGMLAGMFDLINGFD
jgi:hypothetical protein